MLARLTLSGDIGVTLAVQQFIEAYFGGFPRVMASSPTPSSRRARKGSSNDVQGDA
jgi:hypothetical protein